MAADNAWMNSDPAEPDPFARRTEHLEPQVGAVLMFQGIQALLHTSEAIEGQRFRLKDKHPNWSGVFYYYLRLLDDRDDETALYLRVDQESMDRCGRLLVREEQGDGH